MCNIQEDQRVIKRSRASEIPRVREKSKSEVVDPFED